MANEIVENYTIKRTLGQGGMGTVYLARDTQTNAPVAIKVLKDRGGKTELLERFRREGEALHQLNHPNIVAMLDAFEQNGQHYLVMEYVPGGDLDELLNERGRLDEKQILKIALELSDALTRAHHLDIIHRDIKPANILLAEDGTPRLTDFGVAAYHQYDTNITQEGAIVGTVPYLSPEGCQGKVLDTRSDIWSFGVLLFQMLTGVLPFQGDSIVDIIMGIMGQPIPDLEAMRPDAPEELVDLIYRMLAKSPEARIPSVRLVGAEIEGMLKGFSVTPATGDPAKPKDSLFIKTPTKSLVRLPIQAVPFVGREKELGEIKALLSNPTTRLLTLLGPGGMGKSRLGIELARRMADEYSYGVCFVGLAPLSEPEQIISAVADGLGFQFKQGSAPEEQIKNYLCNKQLLLVLDNFEHLLGGTDIVSDLLAYAPDLKIVSTSRASLNLHEEHLYEVVGMQTPEGEGDTVFEEFDAVALFITYAQRMQPDYDLTTADKPAVVKLCQLVGGMPLGIELAAGWIRTLPPDEIATELESDIDFLSTSLSNLPERQRSMRAVFDYSWKMLDDTAQDVFPKLCLFPDGFTRQAAKAVTGASVRMLSMLTEQSLIQRDPTGRFRIHELMRQFGEEKLKEDDEQYAAVMNTYWGYYADWLGAIEPVIKNGGIASVLGPVLEEFENIALGWAWGAGRGDFASIQRAQFSLLEVVDIKSKEQITYPLVQTALAALAEDAKAQADFQHLRWTLSVREMWFMDILGIKSIPQSEPEIEALVDEIITQEQLKNIDHIQAWLFANMTAERILTEGIGLCEQLLDWFEKTGKRFELGAQLFYVGQMYLWKAVDTQKGVKYLERSRVVNRQVNPWLLAGVGFELGTQARYRGDFDQAEAMYLESLEIGLSLGSEYGIAMDLMFLGRNYCMVGAWDAARKQFAEAHQNIQEINDEYSHSIWLFAVSDMQITLGEFEDAQENLQKWDGIIRQFIQEDVISNLFFITSGRHAYYQGKYDLAYENFLKAAEALKQVSEQNANWAFLFPYLGRGAMAVGKQDEAWAYFEKGLRLAIELEFWPNVMQVLAGMASLLAETGQVEEAVELAAIPAIHKTTFYYERQLINAFLNEMAEKLPSDTFVAAKALGRKLTPQVIHDRYFREGEIE